MSKLKSPESLRYSAYGSTAWPSPAQAVSTFQPAAGLRRNKSLGGPSTSNRFHVARPMTRRNYSVRTQSLGVSACLGVADHVTQHMPMEEPSIATPSTPQ